MTEQLELELEIEQVDGELLAHWCWEYVEARMSDIETLTEETFKIRTEVEDKLNNLLEEVNKRGVTKIL